MLVVFLHVHKCAGLSFKQVLQRHYRIPLWKKVGRRLLQPTPAPLRKAVQRVDERTGYFAGHFGYGVHYEWNFPAKYVTFLREPRSRLVSLYNYSRSEPGAFYYKHAAELNFHDFITSGRVLETDNGMTRFLIGDEKRETYFICKRKFGEMSNADLDIATENLATSFVTPGITERFDESLLLIGDALGIPDLRYVRVNEGPRERYVHEWDDALDDFVKWDDKLYNWAASVHNQHWEAFSYPGDNLLENFREKNRAYQASQRKV